MKMRIIRDRKERKIWICQDTYINKIASRFHLEHLGRPRTPMAVERLLPNEGRASPEAILLYQQKVGSITYATTISRPDIAYAASILASHMQNPSPQHDLAADRVIRYLLGTATLALEYGGITEAVLNIFEGASDASFADDIDTRRSTGAKHFKMFNGSIDWKSHLQRVVGTSTTEVELIALSDCCLDFIWWLRLFRQIGLDLDSIPFIKCDNLQTVGLINKATAKLVTKLRHVDVRQHWLRQEVENGTLAVKWVSTTKMPADGLTKALPTHKHTDFVEQMNLVDIQSKINKLP